ncbi:MAG: bifunctional oligoribonuclease/PAP phosphatase NrnA [Spirochaetia bacterium]|nr:bifunctional oligoribonuclease/PAP phosphatase NrnA [Spirochaetia bacterium]
MIDKSFYTTLYERIMSQDRFLLTTHCGPDPDGIGGELGLNYLLNQSGKDSIVLNNDPISPMYRFLDPESQIMNLETLKDHSVIRDRTIVLIDTSEISRTGEIQRYADHNSIMAIDHHDSNGGHSDTIFQNPSVGSTSEIIYELLEIAGISLSSIVAHALYAGIVADTGYFRFGKTRSRTHEIAGKLMEYGVHPPDIAERLYNSAPAGRLLVKKILYNNLTVLEKDSIAYFHIKQSDWEQLGLVSDDLGGIVNELIEPYKIKAGILFTERSPNTIRVSVRSKGNANMLPAVAKYGGGGHKNACGATILLDLQSAIKEFIPEAISCIQNS